MIPKAPFFISPAYFVPAMMISWRERWTMIAVSLRVPSRWGSAKNEGASMIVLGTRRRTGLRAAILGSVSHAVIAEAPCPVVTVSEFASQTIQSDFAERTQSNTVRRDRAESLDWLQRPLTCERAPE